MATASTSETLDAPERRTRRRRRLRLRPFQLLVLGPTLLVSGVFVYGFIAYSARVSVSQWSGLLPDLTPADPLWSVYESLFQTPRFQADLRNIVVFTVLFLALSVAIGLVLAILVHQTLVARGLFRSVFLLPYAFSFIVTGVVWRWIFTPSTGANLLLSGLGIETQPGWITDPTVVGDVSGALAAVVPGADGIQIQLGIPLAIIPVVIAASWQLGGFAMANFLAALSTVPRELHEAAQIDGASTTQYYLRIVLPWLRPMIVVVLVILGHVALKSFDLVYAMVGQGPGFATDVPGLFVFDTTFRAGEYNTGAAASIVMFVLVAAIILPYLHRSYVRGHR
jgi:glucose/mannose transport system permease protein